MISLYLTLGFPAFGMIIMLIVGKHKFAGTLNILIGLASFIASLFLTKNILQTSNLISSNHQFYVDSFSILSILLTTFVITTTAIFSRNYMWSNVLSKRISLSQWHLYHILYQAFALTMLLALTANNIGLIWVAMEGATLATVLLVSLYRTPQAIEAAWKYFILCIVGIALALFGTILIYFSARGVLEIPSSGIFWNVLYLNASKLDPAIVKFAFVFLLVGYGTKIGLVPLHNWLPDAHSESPAPMSTLLSGLLLNVALYALIRFKILADLVFNTHLAGHLMMGFGLISFIVAAILLNRQRNIKRLFSYSSIEHMGLMTFAFGVGGQLATFAAIFYMLMHSLAKSAIFVTVGNMIHLTETQDMQKIRGLIYGKPIVGWSLLIACLAISGFPPFGIFTSELMVLIATFKAIPWVMPVILLGIIIALAGLLRNIQPIVYGEPSTLIKDKICMSPAILHLGLILILGIYLPSSMGQLISEATKLITATL